LLVKKIDRKIIFRLAVKRLNADNQALNLMNAQGLAL
jgi:hypothetical protein